MPTNAPPFRADHVGSLLRPAEIKDARARRAEGKLSAADLAAVEDAAIKRLIARQEDIGLRAATDGEFRRAAWHWDFLGLLEGVETGTASSGHRFKGATTPATLIKVVGKVGFGRHPMLEHFAFVKRTTRVTAKMCIPSPTHLVFNAVPVDAFFLEYDSERAGSFEPLRFMPKTKAVVLGLVSSKLAAIEPKEAIKRRIDEATRYVDLERLHLSPQCGFASTQEGNVMSEDEQWRKLAHVVEIAGEVWGE